MQLVVIFDADMVCFKDFFVKILAELYDPQVAIVLTPQKFHNYDIMCDIFNHSNLIYWQVSLPGLDGWDNVSCTGTNFVIRARAAQEVITVQLDNINQVNQINPVLKMVILRIRLRCPQVGASNSPGNSQLVLYDQSKVLNTAMRICSLLRSH